MLNIYAKSMMKNLHFVIQKNCYACQINDPSQLHHELCLMATAEEKVAVCFDELFEMVDENDANQSCFNRIRHWFIQPLNNVHLSKVQLKSDLEWMQTLNQNFTELLKSTCYY